MTDGDLHHAPFDETARDVLDSLPCGVISTLPDGVIVEVNKVFVAWTGQRREALAGRRFQDLLTISGQIFYEAQFAPSLRRPGVVREMTCQLKRVSREPLDILVNSTLKLDSNGAPAFIRTAIVEATDRVKYEEELHRTRTAAQQLAAIVTSSSDAVVSAGLDGAVLSWNPGATALFGYTEAEAVGSSVTELIVPKDLRAERLQKHQKLLAGETVFYKDTVRHRKDGSLVQVEITASPMRDAQGRVAAASLIVRDIHDQKAKNDALRKSEARYRALVDASTTAVWRANAEGVVTYATDLWKELTGQTNEEQLGWGWLNAIHPDDRNSTIARWNNSLETRTIHENEFRVRTVAGHYRWFGVRAVPMFNLDGSVEGWVGANTDIHDEKTAKEAMRLSEVRYRRLFEAAHDGVLILDPDTRKITDANPFMTKLIGYAHDQLIGKELFEIGFFSDAQASRDMFQTLKATREIRYENLPLQSQDGNLREVEVVANLYDEDGRAVIQCNVRDITERRRTEAELREKKQFLQRIAEVTPNILQVFDLAERRSLFTNDNLASQLGFAHEEIQAMGSGVAQTLMHPDDLPRFEAHLAAVRALGDGEVARFEHRMRDRAGQWHWFLSHDAVFARDATGAVREIIGAASNITEQKNAEEALRNTALRMALATEASSIGIWERNVRTNRIRWDAQMFWIYGVPPTDDGFVSYETWRSAVHPEDAAHNEVVLNATVRRNGRSAREFRILRADTGECRTIQSVETMRANPGGEPEWMVGTNVDITERKQAERHIQLLMGEVNHRTKNLLSVVQAIARQTALTGDPATFTTRLSDRIQALAAGHDLLVRNRWEGVEVSELVHSQLAHFAGLIDTRVSMNGPPLRLSPSAAQGIGMALHEMGTNAAKYGALSNTTGTVHISWDRKLEPEPVFSMQWVEDGGPEVAPPSHQGFGRSVIERTVEASIDGKVDVEYLKSGFVWKLSAPISTVVEA